MSDDGMTDADRNWWATRIHAQRLDHVRPLPPRSEPIGPQGQHQDPDYIALANAAPRIPGTFPLPGSGIGRGSTNNFLPAQSRRSWTTPAGTSEYVTHNPLPGRPDEDADRAAYQATQIAAERASRLGGSSTLSRRGFGQSPVVWWGFGGPPVGEPSA